MNGQEAGESVRLSVLVRLASSKARKSRSARLTDNGRSLL